MATTRKYLNHLLQNTGITPACSEEERAAAEDIAQIFTNHGFTPEVQEFNASGTPKTIAAVLGVVVFVGAVLMGVGGVVGVIGFLLVLAAAVLYVLERMGKISFSSLGSSGLSQNVIAYHQASGPLASPRNRPVVVVAHYDSPRADLFSQPPYATYRPLIVKLLPYLMVAPAVLAVVRLLPFPGAAKVVLWLLAIIAAVVPLAHAVGVIANRFVLPYTSGSVCNKSSVAAMLGVMDAVAPFERGEEFPNDVPFEDYFSEQVRRAQEAEIEAAVASGDLPEEALNVPADDQQAAVSADAADGPVVPAADPDATLAGTASLPLGDLSADGPAVDLSAAPVSAGATAAMPAIDVEGVVEAAGSEQQTDDAEAEEQAGVDEMLGATVSMDAIPDGGSDAPLDTDRVELEDDRAAIEDEQAAEDAPVDDGADSVDSDVSTASTDDASQENVAAEPVDDVPAEDEDEVESERSVVNAQGNYRYGPDVIREIGMIPASCIVEYDLSEPAPAPEPVENPVTPAADRDMPDADADNVADVEDAELPHLASDESEDEGSLYDEAGYGEYDGQEAYSDDDTYGYDEYADYDDGYQDGFSDPRPHLGGSSSALSETFSMARAKAASFLDGALRKGKSMIDSMTSHEGVAEDAREDDLDAGASEDASATESPAPDAGTSDAVVPDGTADADVAAGENADTVAADEPAPTPEVPDVREEAVMPAEAVEERGATQRFSASDIAAASSDDALDPDATVAKTTSFAPQAETDATAVAAAPNVSDDADAVDALMAEITAPRREQPRPAVQNRAFSMVPDPAAPSVNQMATVNRSSLFDLPDPSTTPVDPFSTESSPAPAAPANHGDSSRQAAFSVISSDEGVEEVGGGAQQAGADVFETISADAPAPVATGGRGKDHGKHGIGKLFHRKKQRESSMSDWLGVDDDFDAKSSGRDIGSWDNFEGDDWKGGATGAPGTSEEELRDAVTSMGDDELLGHDIWFVATGASELGNAGIQAFLDTHRDKLRGVFLINLESIGAGEPCMLATEGGDGGKRVLKGDKRIMNLVRRVSGSFHREFPAVEMPYLTTDAYRAMNMSLRSLTIAGIEGNRLACSHTVDDLPYRINEKSVRLVADVVTEVIRRS